MTWDAQPVVVIGAGVSGLTTAVCLAEAGRRVVVWSSETPQRTTSRVASALWGPSFQEPAAKTLAWTEQSLREFRALAGDPNTGVRMASAMAVGALPVGDAPPQAALLPDLRACDPAEVPAGWSSGARSTMAVVDMPRYLDYLRTRLETAGGAIETRTVRSLDEAAEQAPVVVNCSGLGARELAGDHDVHPVFGQHVVLSNPGLESVFIELTSEPESTLFVPHPGRVVCGGIRVPHRWDERPDPELSRRITRRCREVEPALRNAEVLDTVTGLRPARSSVRVEAERLGSARCIHNYGHDGNGVSLSWGCAREAAALTITTS